MNFTKITRYPLIFEGETVHVGTAKEITTVLEVVGDQHDRDVLEQLQPHLAEMLHDPNDLTILITSLSPDNQVYLLEALGSSFAKCLREARYLTRFLAITQDSSVEEKTLAVLGTSGLQALIITSEDLADVLQWLYGGNTLQVLALLGNEHLKRLIKSGIQLSFVLDALDIESQENLLVRLGWEKVVATVHNAHDLAHLLRALVEQESKHLIDSFTREQLLSIIGDADDWRYVNERIDASTAQYLYSKLGIAEPKGVHHDRA